MRNPPVAGASAAGRKTGTKSGGGATKKNTGATNTPAGAVGADGSPRWDLRLYIAGETPRSRAAIDNLKKVCELYLNSNYTIEVIDLVKNPSLARGDQIVALPTLVRKIPVPMRKIIGDLSNTERVLVGLDIRSRK